MKGLLAISLALIATIACSSATPNGIPSSPRPARVEPVDPGAPAIVYGDGSFTPRRLEIRPGQQVRFVNESREAFWPASNIHPTHRIYPEFDSGQPVPPGQTWAFTFDRAGFWRFHNHLAPEMGGLVIVKDDKATSPQEPLVIEMPEVQFQSPENIPVKDYIELLQDDALLAQYIRKYGPAATVAIVEDAAAHADVLCHQRAHDIGRISYDLFGPAAFALASHECEAGAYHGATEAMFWDRGTANLQHDVATICGGAAAFFFQLQCIHGVGHGLMAWTSYEMFDALHLCDQLQTDRDQRACYSGVFMENVVGGLSGSMGHHTAYLSEDDPHYPCNALEQRYVAPCYLYHSTRMLMFFDYNYGKVGEACADAPDFAHHDCFESFGRDIAAVTLGEPAEAVEMCHSYVGEAINKVSCLQGAVQARFWETGRAGEALTMCQMLTDQAEKSGCYWMIIVRARELYPTQADFEGFCAHIENSYRGWCYQ